VVGREAFIAVYMLASGRNGTLYIGVTSRLLGRVWKHREEVFGGFTKRYGVKRLVWFEHHELMTTALQREKSLKRWPRAWKINLIERDNPHWDDLFLEMTEPSMKPQFDDWLSPPATPPASS
jgi:putative endonuclease